MNLRRVPIHVVSSLDDIAAFAPADPGGHVLIFDADNTLAPQGAPLDRFGDLVNRAIDRFEDELPPLTSFILPGGSPAAATLHLARTTGRRW